MMGADESRSSPLPINEDNDRTEEIRQLKERYMVSDSHGFVIKEPEAHLPQRFEQYEELGRNLSKYVEERKLRTKVYELRLPDNLDIENLRKGELLLAHQLLSFITSGFVWQNGEHDVVNRLPKSVAIPLCQMSERLGLKPILCYPSMILANWRMVAPGNHEMQNLATYYETPGGAGASWFILTHNCIEVKFAPAIRIIFDAMTFANEGNTTELTNVLKDLPCVFKEMMTIFKRIEEKVEPEHFYDHLRPFYAGWDSKSKVDALKNGLIYEGMYDDKPQQMQGGSAAQSTTLQIVDAALGIQHEGEQREFIQEAQNYMLREHREFIIYVQDNSSIRDTVLNTGDQTLVKAYNSCVRSLVNFRKFHFDWIVQKYILRLQEREPNHHLRESGTGGTGLSTFLGGLVGTTEKAIIGE